MATQYEVDVTLTNNTLASLQGGGYILYGFKAVQTSQGGGVPLVWFQFPTSVLLSNTFSVTWQESYEAYVSTTAISNGVTISTSNQTGVDLGQTATFSMPPNLPPNFSVTNGGASTAISIMNDTTTPLTGGISQLSALITGQAGSSFSPLCAFPLYGGSENVIAPIEKVLLMFSTKPVNTGTVIEQAYSQSILIDLTADNQRAVNFDIDLQWTWGNYSWAADYPPNQSLVPLLIDSSPTASASFKRRSLVLGTA